MNKLESRFQVLELKHFDPGSDFVIELETQETNIAGTRDAETPEYDSS